MTSSALLSNAPRTDSSNSLTLLLQRWSDGDRAAAEQVLDAVYEPLRRMARRAFRGEREDHTLQPTALVHEVVMDLMAKEDLTIQDRTHFFALSACLMRRILVDHSRQRAALKRGGDRVRVPLEDARNAYLPRPRALLALDGALQDLEKLDPDKALIVELRFFGGLTVDQVAEALGASPRTIARQWRRARAWLYQRLAPEERRDL